MIDNNESEGTFGFGDDDHDLEQDTQPEMDQLGDAGPSESVDTSDQEDLSSLFDKAHAALSGDEPAEAPVAEVSENTPAEEPEQSGPIRITHDQDAILVDSEGREHKLRDVVWRTESYHKKLQEVDTELKAYKNLEKSFSTDPVGLALNILKSKEPELAQAFAKLIDKAKEVGKYDPTQVQLRQAELERTEFEQERQAFEQERHLAQVQAHVAAEAEQLKSRLGRDFNAVETKYMSQILEDWETQYRYNPSIERPALAQVYEMAKRMYNYDLAKSGKTPKARKPNTTVARPASTSTSRTVDLDSLWDAAERQLGNM